jgi:hypothetical protein
VNEHLGGRAPDSADAVATAGPVILEETLVLGNGDARSLFRQCLCQRGQLMPTSLPISMSCDSLRLDTPSSSVPLVAWSSAARARTRSIVGHGRAGPDALEAEGWILRHSPERFRSFR